MGLAPIPVEQVFQIIQSIKRSGTTVLLVEQKAHMALQVADYVCVMEPGTIAAAVPRIS